MINSVKIVYDLLYKFETIRKTLAEEKEAETLLTEAAYNTIDFDAADER